MENIILYSGVTVQTHKFLLLVDNYTQVLISSPNIWFCLSDYLHLISVDIKHNLENPIPLHTHLCVLVLF